MADEQRPTIEPQKPEEPPKPTEAEISGEQYWHMMFLIGQQQRHDDAVKHEQTLLRVAIEDLTGFASEIREAKNLPATERFRAVQRNGKFFYVCE